jgi:hypothetical protein
MKIAGQILLACFLLAALQSTAAGIMALCLLMLLWGAIFRTREILTTIGALVLLGLIGNHPVACIVVAGAAFVAVKLGRKPGDGAADAEAAPSPPLLSGRARKAAGSDFGGGDG